MADSGYSAEAATEGPAPPFPGLSERLGDLAGTATGSSQMGLLLTEQREPTEAVPWHIRALAIRLNMQVPQAMIDVRALNELRRLLGAGPFGSAIGAEFDDVNRANLFALLDRFDGEYGEP